MYIYILCFLLSCMLLYLSARISEKRIAWIMEFIAVLLPIVLAGCRSLEVGTDVQVYVEPLYKAAAASTGFGDFLEQKWWHIWKYVYVNEFEFGFITVIFAVTKVFHSIQAVLFAIHTLIIVPLYLGIKRSAGKKYVWLGMFIFYFLHYNSSLNMMRQWIAMSLLLYGFQYLLKQKNIHYFIIVMLACLFHTSAFFGVAIFAIYWFVVKSKKLVVRLRDVDFKNATKVVLMMMVILVCMLMLGTFVTILDAIGLHRFVVYINGTLILMPAQFIIRFPMFFLIIYNWKRISKKSNVAAFYLMMIALDIVASQLVSINDYSARIAIYFSEYFLISGPLLIETLPKKSLNRRIQLIALMAYVVVYWMFYSVYRGTNETIPYQFFM